MVIQHKTIIPAAIRGRYATEGVIVQQLEVRPDFCTNTLTSVQKDNVLIIGELPPCIEQKERKTSESKTGYSD